MSRAAPLKLSDYKHFLKIPTRWSDNDVYGHVNNAVYYFYFDTVVNEYLIRQGLLDLENSDSIGLVVNTSCDYFSSITFPQTVNAGLRVSKLGNSSVIYEIGLFCGDQDITSAQGQFTHVYVDKESRRPVAISNATRAVLEAIKV